MAIFCEFLLVSDSYTGERVFPIRWFSKYFHPADFFLFEIKSFHSKISLERLYNFRKVVFEILSFEVKPDIQDVPINLGIK